MDQIENVRVTHVSTSKLFRIATPLSSLNFSVYLLHWSLQGRDHVIKSSLPGLLLNRSAHIINIC